MPFDGELSLAARVALQPPEVQRELLRAIDPKSILYDWRFWGRPDQFAPVGPWQFWAYIAGRGAGKTRAGSEWVREMVAPGKPPTLGALIGPTAASARDVMVEGNSGLLGVFPPEHQPIYEPSKRRITFPSNGSMAILFSAEEPERLRGPQFHWMWGDEVGAWQYQQATWDMAMFGLRLGDNPQCLVTTTPRPTPVLRELLNDKTGMVRITRATTYANKGNLAAAFINKIVKKYEGTNLGRQELLGELITDTPGALWSRGLIEKWRIKPVAQDGVLVMPQLPAAVRTVIGVDPPATNGNEELNPDELPECGIICAFKGVDGHAYVIEDGSLVGTPDQWGNQVNGIYARRAVDRVIAETNQGGQMVEFVLRTVNPNISYLGVHASKGKITRAEPIAALYEQGKVHHVGMFAELEDQMTTYVPGKKSPDRMDALVWALTHLMLEDTFVHDFEPHNDIEPSAWRIG